MTFASSHSARIALCLELHHGNGHQRNGRSRQLSSQLPRQYPRSLRQESHCKQSPKGFLLLLTRYRILSRNLKLWHIRHHPKEQLLRNRHHSNSLDLCSTLCPFLAMSHPAWVLLLSSPVRRHLDFSLRLIHHTQRLFQHLPQAMHPRV